MVAGGGRWFAARPASNHSPGLWLGGPFKAGKFGEATRVPEQRLVRTLEGADDGKEITLAVAPQKSSASFVLYYGTRIRTEPGIADKVIVPGNVVGQRQADKHQLPLG